MVEEIKTTCIHCNGFGMLESYKCDGCKKIYYNEEYAEICEDRHRQEGGELAAKIEYIQNRRRLMMAGFSKEQTKIQQHFNK